MAGGGWTLPGGDFLSPQPPASQQEQQPPPPPPPDAASAGGANRPALEPWREAQESDRHWGLRRQFLLRNLPGYPGADAFQQLLALSHVWSNHVFLGCR